MSDAYPKKYWWIVLVAVPLVGALIAVLPSLFGGGDDSVPGNTINITGSEVGGDVQIVGTQVLVEEIHNRGLPEEQVGRLEDQLQEVKALINASLFDAAANTLREVAQAAPSPAVYNDLGALRLKQGDEAGARAAFESGLNLDPDYEALRLNMAQLDLAEGDAVGALKRLATAGDSAEVRQLRSHVEKSVASGAIEREPNNTRLQPNLLPLGQWVSAQLSGSPDRDVFQFQTADKPRDYVAIELDNRDPALRYIIRVYGENKKELTSFEAANHGQDGWLQFSAQPLSTYLFSVVPHYSEGGSYRVRVAHLDRYDAYEANDELVHAAELGSLDSLQAELMDSYDHDYYRLPEVAGNITIRLTNESSGLRSIMTLFSPDRQLLRSVESQNQGHDIQLSYDLAADGGYYLWLRPHYSEGGKYRLEFEVD